MKRTLFTLFLIFTLASILYLPNTFAQDYTTWNLPEGAKARLGKGWINDIAYSQDSTRLAVASSIGIWIYDANTYTEIALLTGHTERVNAVAFSPDSKMLISGSHDKTVRLWNVETSELLHTLEDHTDYVLAVAFSPDGNKFASSDGDFTIRLWDTHTKQVLHTLIPFDGYFYRDETNWVYDIAFSIDGKTLASADRNGLVRLWDVDTGELLLEMGVARQGRGAKAVAYSSDGVTLATGDGSGYVDLWGARTGKLWQTVGQHRDGWDYGVNSVVFSPDGNILASGGNDRRLKLWDAFTGEQLHNLEGHKNGILGVTFSPDGNTIVSVSWTEIRFWNANTGELLHILKGHTRTVYTVALSPDNKTIASGYEDGTIQLFDVTTRQHKQTLIGHANQVRSVAFSPDEKTLASGSHDETVRLWDVATGEHKQTLPGHKEPVQIVAFSPNGETLASGGQDSTFRLWDANTGEHKQTISVGDWVNGLDFSSDGQMCVIATADGNIYAGNASGGTSLWHLRTERRLRTFVGRGNDTYAVAFSKDGSIIAGDLNNEILLWHPRSGEQLQKLTGHTDRVVSVVFSPDGRTLATGGFDKTIRIWDVHKGIHLQTHNGHTDLVYALDFNADGSTLASGSRDGTVLLWDMTLTDPMDDTPSTPASSDATVSISTTPIQAPIIGKLLTFPLNITEGENVAGYQATVQFDTTVLQYVSSENGDYFPHGAFFVPTVVEGNKVTLAASSLAGESNGDGFLATLTFELIAVKTSTLTLSDVSLVNSEGVRSNPNIVENTQIEIVKAAYPPEDINEDGAVNILDLVAVASNFGETGENSADVNADGVVDIIDLVLVAGAIGNTADAPSVWSRDLKVVPTRIDVQQWLTQAQSLNLTDGTLRRGIFVLEQLLAVLTPKETELLPNYPNPFNPETWIPYQLAKPADVSISIYAADGKLVQKLDLGHKAVGIYQNRSHAAYWNGKNENGESVASGVYFYTFTAGDFTATRKMLIRK